MTFLSKRTASTNEATDARPCRCQLRVRSLIPDGAIAPTLRARCGAPGSVRWDERQPNPARQSGPGTRRQLKRANLARATTRRVGVRHREQTLCPSILLGVSEQWENIRPVWVQYSTHHIMPLSGGSNLASRRAVRAEAPVRTIPLIGQSRLSTVFPPCRITSAEFWNHTRWQMVRPLCGAVPRPHRSVAETYALPVAERGPPLPKCGKRRGTTRVDIISQGGASSPQTCIESPHP